ncbi:MAG: hypothetical protein WCA13_08370 [Terriglobales bacterium]
MKVERSLIAVLSLILAVSSIAAGKQKKGQRGMLESMQSVPCGAKERGLTGLGSAVAALGVEHVNSHEQLCPQYLLRTDEMDYHIRPLDTKHPVVLPVGHEAEFRVKKDRLFLRVVDGDKKTTAYQVVAMQPANSESKVNDTAYHLPGQPVESRPPTNSGVNAPANDGNKVVDPAADHPPQP